MKYKSYNEPGSDRRKRKYSRREVYSFNRELHTSRSKKEARAKDSAK